MIALGTALRSGYVISQSWSPDPASTREDIWFDDINKFLYVDFRKSCATCIRIATWNKGLSVERWNQASETWESEEWDPGIPLPLPKARVIFPLDEFYCEIPTEVINAVAPFKWRQFVLLRMIRHCPETLELLQSNPVLTWLCADAIATSETPATKACDIIMARRRDICGFAGLPATESMVKILGKMGSDAYTQILFNDLRKLFKNKERISRLRLFKKIPAEEIFNLSNRFDFLAWALSTADKSGVLVWDAMWLDASDRGFSTWSDTIRLGVDIGIQNPLKRLESCKSFEEVVNVHNRWSETLSRDRAIERIEKFFRDHGTYSFPHPPLPGNADIVPITTIKELLDEGAEMHHCVGSYSDRIMNGKSYIYRVLRPQRATLEIYSTDNMHRINQLSLVQNGEPSAETWARVRFWFAGAQQEAAVA
jgi:hypothetical protein